jgi:membrane protease YdiL (CAAX protease family)
MSAILILRILRVLLFMIGCAAILAFIAPFARRFPGMESEAFLGVAASAATFALTALFVRWEHVRLADVGAMPDSKSFGRLAFGVLIGALAIAAWAGISILAGQARWTRANEVGVSSIAIAFLAYLCLACREELAFRGFPLRRLHPVLGLWPAQFFVAIVFALEHRLAGATWIDAVLGAGVGSLLFGMAAVATEGLAVPIGIHAAWNTGHWALGLKGTPGIWTVVIDQNHRAGSPFIGIILYDIVMLSTTLAFWLWYRKRR